METSSVSPWFLELDGNDQSFDTVNELILCVEKIQVSSSGKLSISYDDGPRPWWGRFLGLAPRYISGFTALQWCNDFSSLIFLDEDWSEYHVLDKTHPVNPPDSLRLRIDHGNLTPRAIEDCMGKERAFRALREALQTGERPDWVSYRFVE